MTKEELIKHRIEIYQEGIKKAELEKDISSQMYLRGALEELKWLKKEYADQSQEPKQREEFEEITIFEDSTYNIQFRDNLISRGTSDFRIKGSELLKLILPIDIGEQSEVSEAVEFVDWINNNEINGQYYRHQRLNIWNGDYNPDERHYSPLTTQQLYDIFKSKSTNVKQPTVYKETEWGDKEEIDSDNPKYNDPNDPDSFTTDTGCNP